MRLLILAVAVSCGAPLLTAANSPRPAMIAPASIGTSLVKAIARYFGKEGSQEAGEYFAKEGSQQMLQRVAQSAARQGGDEAVEGVARLARLHGPDALKAFDQSPSIVPLLNALDELPPSQVGPALSRLAAGSQGRELAQAVTRHGAAALRSELKHPGVGVVLVRGLGDDGAELASRLGPDQAVAVARHADEIGNLPPQQRAGVLSLLHQDTERMVGFLGRFVEANPGKSLFTVATTTVLLAESERILGGDEVVFDAEGNPIVVRKDGVLGRSIEAGGSAAAHLSDRYLQPLFLALLVFFGTFATLWALMKFWYLHRANKANP